MKTNTFNIYLKDALGIHNTCIYTNNYIQYMTKYSKNFKYNN